MKIKLKLIIVIVFTYLLSINLRNLGLKKFNNDNETNIQSQADKSIILRLKQIKGYLMKIENVLDLKFGCKKNKFLIVEHKNGLLTLQSENGYFLEVENNELICNSKIIKNATFKRIDRSKKKIKGFEWLCKIPSI